MMRLALPPGPLALLCLGAHSDDIEIGAGGTVLRLLEEHPGSRVDWVVFSATSEREREAAASAAEFLAGAGERCVETHGFRDGYFPFEGALIKDEFERLKARVNPFGSSSTRAGGTVRVSRTGPPDTGPGRIRPRGGSE